MAYQTQIVDWERYFTIYPELAKVPDRHFRFFLQIIDRAYRENGEFWLVLGGKPRNVKDIIRFLTTKLGQEWANGLVVDKTITDADPVRQVEKRVEDQFRRMSLP